MEDKIILELRKKEQYAMVIYRNQNPNAISRVMASYGLGTEGTLILSYSPIGTEFYSEIFRCDTLELPWIMNIKYHSCISEGDYECILENGKIKLKDKNGRTNIQIHAGNTVEDITGCVLVGKFRNHIKLGKKFIYDSKKTYNELCEKMPKNKLINLTICYL